MKNNEKHFIHETMYWQIKGLLINASCHHSQDIQRQLIHESRETFDYKGTEKGTSDFSALYVYRLQRL